MYGGSKEISNSDRVKILRSALGLSQRKMAKEFGVSPSAVAHWESGDREISGPVLKLIEIYESKANARTKVSK